MGIGEKLALAVSEDDLGWSDHRHKPVELVAALAAATALGSDIHRGRGNDIAAMRRAVLLLAHKAVKAGKRIRLPFSAEMAKTMAVAALFERIAPLCRTCGGSKVEMVGLLKSICPTCGGLGVHRYTDRERARLCGIHVDAWRKWESRYYLVLSLILSNDRAPQDAAEYWGED